MYLIGTARIGVRLGAAFALMLMLLLIVTLSATLEMRHQEQVIRRIVSERSVKVSLAEDLERNAQGAALPLLRLLLTHAGQPLANRQQGPAQRAKRCRGQLRNSAGQP